MAQHRRQARKCANTKMPDGLTEELIRRINDLPDDRKTAYLKSEILSKFVSSDTDAPETRKARAINKWLATERNNEATNDRLFLTPREHSLVPGVSFGRFVDFCQSLIISVIGETAPLEALIGSFSGGASTSRPRTESHPAGKYLGKADATQRCLELFEDLLSDEMDGWLRDGDIIQPNIVPGNVMFTVPKKTDIDRVCCKEPDLNMFIQKGIGNFLRRKLRSEIGINLNDQSINRSLAREGSITDRLATFDLSSASDSISSELVSLLIPECWFTLLDSVRSPVTIIDGEEHRNHMFSSMGNGFTFELQSLLFWAMTKTICYLTGTRGRVSIYGDDIICPSDISAQLPVIFEYFGFAINLDKSFYEGDFRESCGGHYSDGYDITPFYVNRPIAKLTDIIEIANKLRQWADIKNGFSMLDPCVYDTWLWLKNFVPPRLWGGDDTNSIYQLVSPDEGGFRLVEETVKKQTGEGGYYHWLNATWDRTGPSDGIQMSQRSVTRNRFRLRPVRRTEVTRLQKLFYQEQLLAPSMSSCEGTLSV